MQIVWIGASVMMGLIAGLYITLAVGFLIGAVKLGDTDRLYMIRRKGKHFEYRAS